MGGRERCSLPTACQARDIWQGTPPITLSEDSKCELESLTRRGGSETNSSEERSSKRPKTDHLGVGFLQCPKLEEGRRAVLLAHSPQLKLFVPRAEKVENRFANLTIKTFDIDTNYLIAGDSHH